jgi:hypothetical protein
MTLGVCATSTCDIGDVNITSSVVGPFPASSLKALNMSNPSHGLFTNLAPSIAIVCNNAARLDCAPSRPVSTVLSATVTGPSGTFINPFAAVLFFYQDPAGWWMPIGSAGATVTDFPPTRTWRYQLTWSPSGLRPAGIAGTPYKIMAVGIASGGSALLSDAQAVMIEGN